jgi:hypothetical protein
MSRRDIGLLLLDMKECRKKIIHSTTGQDFQDFLNGEKSFDGDVRTFPASLKSFYSLITLATCLRH